MMIKWSLKITPYRETLIRNIIVFIKTIQLLLCLKF